MHKIQRSSLFFKLLFFPFLLLSFFTFNNNDFVRADAVTIITTKQSDTYINNYYNTISESLTGSGLASALESLLKAERKSSFSYGSLQTSAFPYIDVDPTRPNEGYIVSFYSGKAVKGYSGMNKEHTWPNSHGGNKIENDPHMVRPTISSENSSRGNEYFSNTAAGWDPAELGLVEARGMAARITLYGAVIGKSGGLELEDVGRGQGTGTGNKMGKLGDLLKWNLDYPVNQKEIIRNETLDSSLNYNRNPFIDRPEYACKIWGNTNANTQNICASATPVEVESISVTPSFDTINLLSNVKGTSLSATILPTNATNKSVTWTSLNTNVATVDSNGYVTGKSVGQATIIATSVSNPTKVAQASIEVVSQTTPVSGVTLNKTATTIEKGKSETLVATVLPSGATNKSVTWASTNPSIASVSNGTVNGLNEGTTTISVTTNDGNFKASTIVTVTAPLPTTEIIGSFYNSTSDNNGGEISNETEIRNLLNNGKTGTNAFSGFGGQNVVKSTTYTQTYLPRGGGLALGSSGSAGSLTITLNDDYATSKVEVLINGSVNNATASLSSSSGNIKSYKAGTNGTQYSNPSTGTPYILELNEKTTSFTIGTSRRMIVVEIRITIGEEYSPPSPNEEANAWSNTFLELTSAGCELNDYALLLNAWNILSDQYQLLSSEAQNIIKTASSEYNETDAIMHAKARYYVIMGAYNFNDFINNQTLPLNSEQIIKTNDFGALALVFITISIVSLGYLFIKVKR